MPKMIHANMHTSLVHCSHNAHAFSSFFYVLDCVFFFRFFLSFIFQLDIYKPFFRLSRRWFVYATELSASQKVLFTVVSWNWPLFPCFRHWLFSVYFTEYSALSQLSESNNRFCVRFNVANNYISRSYENAKKWPTKIHPFCVCKGDEQLNLLHHILVVRLMFTGYSCSYSHSQIENWFKKQGKKLNSILNRTSGMYCQ